MRLEKVHSFFCDGCGVLESRFRRLLMMAGYSEWDSVIFETGVYQKPFLVVRSRYVFADNEDPDLLLLNDSPVVL